MCKRVASKSYLFYFISDFFRTQIAMHTQQYQAETNIRLNRKYMLRVKVVYLPICETDGGGYIKGLADPIIDGTWWLALKIELVGTNIVVDVCDMFDGPRFPYGLGDDAYEP